MKNNVNRLYQDLAWLWPIWGDVEEYSKESEFFAKLIRKYAKIEVRSLLDMGCGGGKNTFHLKKYFAVTGIDISEAMLSNARSLNPDCEFYFGDMRNCNLNRQFDSVFINDSINCMTTKEDLFGAFQTAYKHLRAGGAMITYAEIYKENFQQNKTIASVYKKDNVEVTFIENYYDPNPEDDTYELTLIYLIRENGKLRIEHDFHTCGLFTLDFWKKSLKKANFEVYEEQWNSDNKGLPVFACTKHR